MERDRGAALIKQAAFEGVVDFSKARPSDRDWWMRLRWLLDELEKENLRRVQELQLKLNFAVLDYNTDPEKQFDYHWNRSNEFITKIYNGLFPWEAKKFVPAARNAVNNEYKSLVNEWKRRFGDPNDPKVAAGINSLYERLVKSKAKNKRWTTPSNSSTTGARSRAARR